ncbi:MAG: hypothetical protein J0H43_01110, partial [Actinobacteria bacterium]|nr:hypothetical protein [Actinomycetota bacterium]
AGATTPSHTLQLVDRPVHANGTPVSGYRVVNESDSVTCYGASPVAVSPNIAECAPDASYAVACWKSAGHTVLCLRDPLSRVLYRVRYTGNFPTTQPVRHAVPLTLALLGGGNCYVRDGGAWSSIPSHPTWVGYYACNGHAGDVYGAPNGDGISHTTAVWTVQTVAPSGQGAITRRSVDAAYYVGSAA